MAIGVFALVVGIVCVAISAAGIRDVERPIKKERVVEYPYPKEL